MQTFHNFHKLPGELRELIYDFALTEQVIRPKEDYRVLRRVFQGTPNLPNVALLAINQQTHVEATRVLYRRGTFVFDKWWKFKDFINAIPSRYKTLIRKVVLIFPHDEFLCLFGQGTRPEWPGWGLREPKFFESVPWEIEDLRIEFRTRGWLHDIENPAENTSCQFVLCKWIVKAVLYHNSEHHFARSIIFQGREFTEEWGFSDAEKEVLSKVMRQPSQFSYTELGQDSIHDE